MCPLQSVPHSPSGDPVPTPTGVRLQLGHCTTWDRPEPETSAYMGIYGAAVGARGTGPGEVGEERQRAEK